MQGMIVYIHNALLVPILHDYKYFNSLCFLPCLCLLFWLNLRKRSQHGWLEVGMSFSYIW